MLDCSPLESEIIDEMVICVRYMTIIGRLAVWWYHGVDVLVVGAFWINSDFSKLHVDFYWIAVVLLSRWRLLPSFSGSAEALTFSAVTSSYRWLLFLTGQQPFNARRRLFRAINGFSWLAPTFSGSVGTFLDRQQLLPARRQLIPPRFGVFFRLDVASTFSEFVSTFLGGDFSRHLNFSDNSVFPSSADNSHSNFMLSHKKRTVTPLWSLWDEKVYRLLAQEATLGSFTCR